MNNNNNILTNEEQKLWENSESGIFFKTLKEILSLSWTKVEIDETTKMSVSERYIIHKNWNKNWWIIHLIRRLEWWKFFEEWKVKTFFYLKELIKYPFLKEVLEKANIPYKIIDEMNLSDFVNIFDDIEYFLFDFDAITLWDSKYFKVINCDNERKQLIEIFIKNLNNILEKFFYIYIKLNIEWKWDIFIKPLTDEIKENLIKKWNIYNELNKELNKITPKIIQDLQKLK